MKQPITTENCVDCNGRGYINQTDIMAAKSKQVMCISCAGQGFKKVPFTDGIRCYRLACIPVFWESRLKGEVQATLELRVFQIRNQYGEPEVKKNSKIVLFKRDKVVPRCYIEIAKMFTEPKHRRKGVMSKLLDEAEADPKIEYFCTSWDDSTEEGKELLMKRGYTRQGILLIKRMDNAAKD
jgi:GNAT superfamily N-acetyltransferase